MPQIVAGPFLPCTDLMGWWSLRAGIWVIFLLALLGNGSVLFINMFSHSKMDVTKFLICNLASADLMMGVYLGFLAIVDASTLGECRGSKTDPPKPFKTLEFENFVEWYSKTLE